MAPASADSVISDEEDAYIETHGPAVCATVEAQDARTARTAVMRDGFAVGDAEDIVIEATVRHSEQLLGYLHFWSLSDHR